VCRSALTTNSSAATVRVLPADVRLSSGLLPRSSFPIFAFSDPADSPLAVVDTLSTDVVHSDSTEVARYAGHYDRLREAALPNEDSLAYLEETAELRRD
jgi:hypothetical protein